MRVILTSLFILRCLRSIFAVDHPEDFPNLLAGSFTDGNRFSTGNTLPLVGLPWGFNHWAPQTKEDGYRTGSWWFSGSDHTFTWLRCTHQPSPWIGDWGYFLFMPQIGPIVRSPINFWEPRGAVIKPYLFDATVAPDGIRIELSPTMHGAMLRVTFPPETRDKHVCFSRAEWTGRGGEVGNLFIRGQNKQANFERMIVSRFGLYIHAMSESAIVVSDHDDLVCFKFKSESTVVTVRMGTSLISEEQALLNLNRELDISVGFDEIVKRARGEWNSIMRRVDVVDPGELSGYSSRHLTVFYTGLYRALTFPRRLDEVNASGHIVHYSPYDRRSRVYPGPLVTDNGFWDTYRTVYPLLSLLYPDKLGAIIEGWLNSYREGGWLPSWASPGYRNCMVGTFADVTIADAIVKGIKGFDLLTARDALLKDSFEEPPEHSRGAVGKADLQEYITRGYIAHDRSRGSNDHVSRTLDFGFADFSVSRAFQKLAELDQFSSEKADLLEKARALYSRSQRAYSSLFDIHRGLMVSKDPLGRFEDNFDELEWGKGYVEGNAWHHSFPSYAIEIDPTKEGAGHSRGGLPKLYGGSDKMLAQLRRILSLSGKFGVGSYNDEIHEMVEARALAMGQYSHNNQPCHHILYLFALLGDRQTTEVTVRKVMDKGYGVDFFAGDEDNGEQGAWFVLSALGLYSVTPGTTQYVLGSPIFKHVRVLRTVEEDTSEEERKYFDIIARGTGEGVVRVLKVTVNGEALVGPTVDDAQLQATTGVVLRFVMEGEDEDAIDTEKVTPLERDVRARESFVLGFRSDSSPKLVTPPIVSSDSSAAHVVEVIDGLKAELQRAKDSEAELQHRLDAQVEAGHYSRLNGHAAPIPIQPCDSLSERNLLLAFFNSILLVATVLAVAGAAAVIVMKATGIDAMCIGNRPNGHQGGVIASRIKSKPDAHLV